MNYLYHQNLVKKKENWIELTSIEYLLSETKKGNVYVMGLLTELTEGQYYLEDTGGFIKLDLKKAFSRWFNYGVFYCNS